AAATPRYSDCRRSQSPTDREMETWFITPVSLLFAGRCHCRFRFSFSSVLNNLALAMGQIFIKPVAQVDILLRLLPQPLGIFGLALGQHLKPGLLLHQLSYLAGRSPGIKHERILSQQRPLRVVAIEQPLTGID